MTVANDNLAGDVLKGADAIAEYLGLPRRSVYHSVAAGDLPVFRMGETILARKSTLLGWIEAQEALSKQRAA